ncbi:TetR/AcrR family transcriptional regulator [bacterium]|nr:TetR/AcrR family transcriptional regulator [bacterium]
MDIRDKRSEILQAARDQFLKFGYRKTTLDDVAGLVHIQKSTLYHYFNGKEELFRAVTRDVHEERFKIMEEIFNSSSNIRSALFSVGKDIRECEQQHYSESILFHSDLDAILPVIRDDVEIYALRVRQLLIDNLEKAVEHGELSPLPTIQVATGLMFTFMLLKQRENFFPIFSDQSLSFENMIDLVLDNYYSAELRAKVSYEDSKV